MYCIKIDYLIFMYKIFIYIVSACLHPIHSDPQNSRNKNQKMRSSWQNSIYHQRKYRQDWESKNHKDINYILPSLKIMMNLESQGIYKVPCRNCDQTYIDQTNKRIHVRRRTSEHSMKRKMNKVTGATCESSVSFRWFRKYQSQSLHHT